MKRLGVPAFLTVQLRFVFRYLRVLLEELLTMRRARDARSYGKRRYPLPLWGSMMGQLFIRTVDRSQRIHRAMLARGFNGTIPFLRTESDERLSSGDFAWIAVWGALFAVMRIFDISDYLHIF